MKKKFIAGLLVSCLLLGTLIGCVPANGESSTDVNKESSSETNSNSDTEASDEIAEEASNETNNEIEKETDSEVQDKKLNIVCTTFPQYDWVKQIAGDNVNLTLLLEGGADLHSYQATTNDITAIASSDILIYIGGMSDSWIEDVLETTVNEDICAINLMEVLGDKVKEEELKEGMEHSHEDEIHDHDEVLDEHIWLSLKNAKYCVESIANTLVEKDSVNAETYMVNASNYISELDILDTEYTDVIKNAPLRKLVFADRFPFRYLVDDYDLDYFAAFSGCSAETEASFETIVFLAEKVNEWKLNTILIIDGSDGSIARTVTDNTEAKNQEILQLNSMQSVTKEAIEEGTTYLSAMQDNLKVLTEALSN